MVDGGLTVGQTRRRRPAELDGFVGMTRESTGRPLDLRFPTRPDPVPGAAGVPK